MEKYPGSYGRIEPDFRRIKRTMGTKRHQNEHKDKTDKLKSFPKSIHNAFA